MLGKFAGWLELRLAWAGGPEAFHIEGALSGPIKLKWMQVRVSKGSVCRGNSSRTLEADMGANWRVSGCCVQGCLGRVAGVAGADVMCGPGGP